MAIMSGRQAIMEIFQAEGVQYLFGNPAPRSWGLSRYYRTTPAAVHYVPARRRGHGRCPHVRQCLWQNGRGQSTRGAWAGQRAGYVVQRHDGQDAVGSDGWPAG